MWAPSGAPGHKVPFQASGETGAGQAQFKCPSGEDGGDTREMGDKKRPYSVSHRTACSNKNPTVSISPYLQHFQIYWKWKRREDTAQKS